MSTRAAARRWLPADFLAAFRVRFPLPAGLMLVALLAMAVLVPLGIAGAYPGQGFWARTEVSVASAIAFAGAWYSFTHATGSVRDLRRWTTYAIGIWLIAELLRNVELAVSPHAGPALSDLARAGVVACALPAFASSLCGRVERSEEIAFYMDAAIVFFAVAAATLALLGTNAVATAHGVVLLAYVIFFASSTGAMLLLNVTLRAERGLRGAYLMLGAVVLIGFGYLLRLQAVGAGTMPETGLPVHLVSAGLLAGMLAIASATDAQEEDFAYARLADRVRAALPLVAVSMTPVLLLMLVLRALPTSITVLGVVAIGLVAVTVAARQRFLLTEREAAVRREQHLSRELATAEAKYRALVERQPGIVYLAEPGAQGRWHYVSPQIERILGYTPQHWLDDPSLWADRIHPEDRQRILADEGTVSPGQLAGSEAWEYRLMSADGREVWVLDDESVAQIDVDGQPTLMQGVLLDITERKRAEEALRASEEQTRLIIETASYAYIGMDSDGSVAAWNQRAVDTFGWSRDEALGRPLDELIIPPAMRNAHRRGLSHYLATGEGPILSKRTEVTALHRDGREFPVELTIWPVRSGGSVQFNALVDDITGRKQLEEQLRHQALHDALTGLPNRVLFTDRLQHSLERRESHGDHGVAVFFVDLDDFKTVNDSLGHTVGDILLAAVADRLRSSVRPEDTVARLGGDEFAILVEDVPRVEPGAMAARILDQLARPIQIDGRTVAVKASIGVSLSGAEGASPDELLRNADLAMYMAKARGKNRHALYTAGMHEQAQRRLDLKRELEEAIRESHLEVHYQPLVALADGAVTGLEALLRWRGADGTYVPLAEVIPLAEETGLIIPIGRFVLERACADAARWQALSVTRPPLTLAVNISPMQLEHGTLLADVERALADSDFEPDSLVLELTEGALASDSLDALRTLRDLRGRGVRIALDDFGTGYSSLARLRRFPVDIVKIDRGFVASVGSVRGASLVQSIIDLGRSLGMEVVAEGIETREQLEALRQRGALVGQGYYFSRPLPALEVTSVLAAGRLPGARRRGQRVAARGA